MKNTLLSFIFFLMLVPQPSLAGDAHWKEKMQNLYKSLTSLLTDVCSDQRYYDPKNASRIEAEIKSISSFSHDLSKNKKMTIAGNDPTLQLFSGLLAEQTKEAYQSFRGGNREYARSILRSVPSSCLACHSRNATGPDLGVQTLEPSAPLKPTERTEFFAATRQFDRAIESFQSFIKDPKLKIDPYVIEKSVRDALLISVRIKRDPKLTLTILQAALDNPNSPHFIKEDLLQWKKSAEEWAAEPARQTNTEEGLYAEAVKLLAQARKEQTYSMDHSADITFLRASTVLYDLLQTAPTGKHVSEALLSLGMCYEVLSPRKLESLNNIYYEACIKHAPHTQTAQACYRRYEQSIYFGFTGSAGTHLPADLKQKLLELWALAMNKKGQL